MAGASSPSGNSVVSVNGGPVPALDVPSAELPPFPADPAAAIAKWARECLKVPPGHPSEGEPMALPGYGESFLRDALAAEITEALFC